MPFVRVDDDRTWKAIDGLHRCPQIPVVALADSPYFNFDFSEVLDEDTVLSAPVVVETAAKTVTISDASASPDGKRVSVKATAMTPVGNFTLRCTATLSTGTTQKISKEGLFKVL
jgi:hypothetical protein